MSSSSDRILGMHRRIPRRDFLNGTAVAIGTSLVASSSILSNFTSAADAAALPQLDYPPAKTGMRGSHDGSWEVAHSLRDGKHWTSATPDNETYDLIVVGAGISGLAAAYFYRQQAGPSARILILDNHDDFGGHAKRNEFTSGGRTLIGYGGTQSIASPNLYSPEAKELFRELGIEPKKFETYNDRKFYASRGLGPSIFFDKETFGVDRLVRGSLHDCSSPGFVAQLPISDAARRDLLRLYTEKTDYLAGMDPAAKKSYLAKTSYKDYLVKNVKVSPEIPLLFTSSTYGLFGVGIDAVPAADVAGLGSHPGFAGLGLADYNHPGLSWEVTRQDDEPYIYHFPDGNASIARLLVRSLIPGVAPGHTMEDVVLAKFDYQSLDDPRSPVRIRLNSTAVHVHNLDRASGSRGAEVTYVQLDQARSVRASACVLACWNMIIPYLCPEMSDEQKQGLAYQVKVPLAYTNVQLRNWQAFDKLKIQAISCPNCMFSSVGMDFPVSMGGYEFTQAPDQPCVLHLQHIPVGAGATARDMQRAGRMRLLATDFAMFERNIRSQLARTLGPAGFDPAVDIQAITVNRWPHGYAYEYNSLYDPIWPPGKAPHEIARQPFGNIHIANSDAGAFAYTNEAIDQGFRAVKEIVSKKS